MREGPSKGRPRKFPSYSRSVPIATIVVLGTLALIGSVRPAAARQYSAGDIDYLVNLWDRDQQRFKGTVQGIDTFSALGTVDKISQSGAGNASDVIVDIGLRARVVCSADAAGVAVGDMVTVSGRIDTIANAVSQMRTNQAGAAPAPGDRPRDSLGLRSCTVQKALRPTKK